MKDFVAEDRVMQLKEQYIPDWLDGKKSYLSSLFDLMKKADSHNRHKLAQAYPLESRAFKEWQNGLA